MAQVSGDVPNRGQSPSLVDIGIENSSITSDMAATNTNSLRSGATDSCRAFTKLSLLIPDTNKLHFSTPVDLANKIDLKIQQCLDSESGCYILVTDVSEDKRVPIYNALRDLGIHRGVRCTYEYALRSLIIRLMPGAAHEVTCSTLSMAIAMKIAHIPGHLLDSFYSHGRAHCEIPGRRSKQADQGISPSETRKCNSDWPSLVVEVGYPEHLPSLRCDSEWWLENSGGQTRMVIVITICMRPKARHLECWEMLPDPNQRVTRSSHPTREGCSQYFDIDHAGAVSGPVDGLVIPYNTVFDKPHPSEADIILSQGKLSKLALHIFGGLL
ncbi:hypothetical protein HOY80DRAFT_1064837 [Tuber brumale]|nr:hypothetical protein HOY80DRAFT_1064837 [Tuber brumale]